MKCYVHALVCLLGNIYCGLCYPFEFQLTRCLSTYLFVYLSAYLYIYMYACMCKHVCSHVCVFMYICMFVCIYVFMCVSVSLCVCVCARHFPATNLLSGLILTFTFSSLTLSSDIFQLYSMWSTLKALYHYSLAYMAIS